MWPNPQQNVDLVTFAEEIINGKLHFLCSCFQINAWSVILEKKFGQKLKKNKENLTIAENFDIYCFVTFDWHCQKLICERKTGAYAVFWSNVEIALIFSFFLAY